MKTILQPSRLLLAAAVTLLPLVASPHAEARSAYGVAGPRGAAVVGSDRAVAVTRRGVAVAGPSGAAVVRRPVAPLPRGYVAVVPSGYRTVVYRGYSCRFVGGIYYRPVMYQGSTVYVVVD
jgi:hypothetical protein